MPHFPHTHTSFNFHIQFHTNATYLTLPQFTHTVTPRHNTHITQTSHPDPHSNQYVTLTRPTDTVTLVISVGRKLYKIMEGGGLIKYMRVFHVQINAGGGLKIRYRSKGKNNKCVVYITQHREGHDVRLLCTFTGKLYG